MMLLGIFSVIGSKTMGYPSAGALGCMIISCVTGTQWKKKPKQDVIDRSTLRRQYIFEEYSLYLLFVRMM